MKEEEIQSFLSEAHAIQHSKLPVWARHTILWAALFFVVAIIWACVGKVDVIVNSAGKLVSSHPNIVMKPLERGVIKEVHVAVGDRVHAGDSLVTFDTVISKADKERLEAEIRSYEALVNRLEAELANHKYAPAGPGSEEKIQLKIFQDREKFYAEKLDYYEKEFDRITRTITSLKENLELQEKRLAGFRDIENMLAKARSSQAVSPRNFKEAQIARMQLESEIGDKKNNILVLESELQSKNAESEAFKSDWKINASQELARTRVALSNSRKEYDKAHRLNSYVELRAPEDAVVHDITPMSIGSAARETEPLMTLVPVGGSLEAEAEIRAEDIGLVKTGDKARIKISAFPFQKYGVIPGTVRFISEDAFNRGSEDPRLAGSFYRARITLEKPEKDAYNLLEKLIPGMEAQAEIMVGDRRVIEYVIHPLIKSLDEAIREP